MIKKPMLAEKITNIKDLKYPFYASPKLDGIRALTINGVLVSRKFKPIPNKHIQEMAKGLPDGLDGELITDDGSPAGAQFNITSGDVMREEGESKVLYHVFDYVKDGVSKPAKDRYKDLFEWFKGADGDFCVLVIQKLIKNEEQLLNYETECLASGHEGVMVKSLTGPYKEGRSTEKEGYLLKLKRVADAEARIVGFEEKMHNNNTAEKDAFGRTKRSTAQAGLVPAGTLGKLLAKGMVTFEGADLEIGTGFDDKLRQEIWNNQSKYLGKIVKYKYQEVGVVDKPRFPVFLGFRSEEDM